MEANCATDLAINESEGEGGTETERGREAREQSDRS